MLCGAQFDMEGASKDSVGTMVVKTQSGMVNLDGIKAANIDVRTETGDVTLLLYKCTHFHGSFDLWSATGQVTVVGLNGADNDGRSSFANATAARGSMCAGRGAYSKLGVEMNLVVRTTTGNIDVEFLDDPSLSEQV